jgi:hypothetical protein
MRIGRPLLKLPIRFCGETLAREVAALSPTAWMPHPQRYDGNSSVPLVSPGGEMVHRTYGSMAPTESLRCCPYILEIMRELDSTWGRSRLMGLEAGAVVPEHVDIHYYWRTHLRIHIPVITNREVAFTCDGETIHMEAGECWILDSFYKHSVANRGSDTRVHLVLDTVGSGHLWDLIEAAQDGAAEPKFLKPGDRTVESLDFEQVNAPAIMSPWEIKTHVAYIADWTEKCPGLEEVLTLLDRFLMTWAGTWAAYGPSEPGLPFYLQHLHEVRGALANVSDPHTRMRNNRPLLDSVEQFILANAIAQPILQRVQAQSGAAAQFRRTA